MQPDKGASLADPASIDPTLRPVSGIARGAAIIASLTILARVLGLARTLVFSQKIGATCLGTAYITANQVPNLVYELVLGGALTSAMVPVLARWAERAGTDRSARAQVSQITSALLTWSFIILIPLTLVIAAAAGPIASLLNPANPNEHCAHADIVSTTGSMLAVFAPQILLYGLSVVLYGLLQSYRRFAAPALGPAVASLVVIAAYFAFTSLDKGLPLARMPVSAELVLSVGTTLGIAVLVAVAIIPTWRLRLRFRPAVRFPDGVARRVTGLAIVGIIELAAYDVSNVVFIALANGRGTTGAVVVFNYGWQAFSSVYTVLGVSIAISAYTVLCAREGWVFNQTCATSTRAIVLACWLGTAVIAAIAVPAAHVLAKQPDQISELIGVFVMFAPGVAAVGVIAILSRVMFAIGRLKVAAVAVGGSWLIVIVACVVLAELAPAHLVVPALALGVTIGQSAIAIPLVIWTGRIRGRAAVQGVGRAALAGLAAAAVAAVIGAGVSVVLPVHHKLLALGTAVVAACAATLVFGVIAYLMDDGDMRTVLGWARRVVRPRA